MGWFGSMALAWKYAMIFGILLGVTLMAGFTKVLYDRNKLKKHTKEQELEAGRKEDQVELNTREKDEGDLFGVRAIEAGYFAGIPQSRPSSAAGSISGTPSLSSNTLVGSFASPKIKTQSPSSSVTSLPLAHASTRISVDPSSLLPSPSLSPPSRKAPPTIKLRPSEAELRGRINHNPAVNMNLSVPPSPVLAQGPRSPIFSGSDSGESEGHRSPQSLSPHSANFPSTDRLKPDHYVPSPPQLPTLEGVSLSVRAVTTPENPAFTTRSAAASIASGQDASPGHSVPPSPKLPPPEVKTPTMPSRAVREEPRSLFPAYSEIRPSSAGKGSGRAGIEQSLTKELERPSSPIQLQPKTYQPSHQRDLSSASSTHSQENQKPHHQRSESDAHNSSISYDYSFPDQSSRNSTTASLSASREQSRRPSAASSLRPVSINTGGSTSDPRFSEFYDAYYRHSQLNVAQKVEVTKRPQQLQLTQPTIVEVPSPLPSPAPPTLSSAIYQPGSAL